MRRAVIAIAALGIATLAMPPAAAQKYPERPVRVIVTFAAGGAPDVLARGVAAQLETQTGQSFVIDNRAGANGVIGTQAVANADPDGYTILHASASFVVNPSVRKSLPYDIWRDFTPVANLGIGVGYLFLVNKDLPVKNLREFIDYAKKNPVFYGSPGSGNTLHLASELFNVKAGIQMQQVPFRGTQPGLTALLSGSIHAMIIPPAAALSFVKDGQIKALGFTDQKPLPDLPDVPLIKDTLPEFQIEGAWHAWLVPSRTKPEIVAKINQEVRQALKDPKVAQLVERAGYLPDDKSPAEVTAFLRAEQARYAEAVKAAKIEPQ